MSSTTNRYNLQIFDWSTDTTRSFIDGLAGLTDSNMQKLEDVIGDIEDIVTSSIQLERVEISSGVDLNSLNDINKVYVSTNDTIAGQCTNIPKSTITSFELRTYKTTYSQDSKYFMQILKTYTNELWIRGCNVDVWTEWKQMATNDDIETINNNIDNINTNIDNINDDITTRINNSIDEINDTINEINTDINSSIDTINDNIDGINSSIGTINTNLTRATERIDTNANNIATNITNITNLTNTMNSFMDDVPMTYATQSELNEVEIDIGNNVKPSIATNATNISNLTNSVANLSNRVDANLIKTSKNTAKFSSQSAFSPFISSCIIGNNTVGSVWIFTGYITYNINSAPSAGNSILSINQQITQYEDVTIICPCMTANNAYITLEVKSGTLYYKSYTGTAPTSGSRYFVSAVIPVSSNSFVC